MAAKKRRHFSTVLLVSLVGLFVVAAAGLAYSHEFSPGGWPAPFGDQPPRIEFTWTPDGEADLKTMKGHLHITDDHGLDFSTYSMTVMEINRTFEPLLEGGIIGRDYETDLNFSWLASDEALVLAGKMTLSFSIADDRGHKTTLTKVVPLKNWRPYFPPRLMDDPSIPATITHAPSTLAPSP